MKVKISKYFNVSVLDLFYSSWKWANQGKKRTPHAPWEQFRNRFKGNCSRKRELEGIKDHDRKGNEARNTI